MGQQCQNCCKSPTFCTSPTIKMPNVPTIVEYENEILKCQNKSLSTGVIYKGQLNKQNLRHGIGKLIWPNKSFYVGHFENNVCCGHGFLKLNDDEIKEGEWKNDQLNGNVSITMKDCIYKGEFLNDLPHGKGVIFFVEKGGKYEGEFYFGKKQGKGNLQAGDFIYEGDFFENSRQGYGKCTWKDGKKYEGNWKKNKMEGKGTFVWSDGTIYEGEYENGLKHGYGILKSPDGVIIYKGFWLKGKIRMSSLF